MALQVGLYAMLLVTSVLGVVTRDWRWFAGPLTIAIVLICMLFLPPGHG